MEKKITEKNVKWTIEREAFNYFSSTQCRSDSKWALLQFNIIFFLIKTIQLEQKNFFMFIFDTTKKKIKKFENMFIELIKHAELNGRLKIW